MSKSCASRLKVGQRIIEVNSQSLLGASHQEAVAALRSAGNSLHILVCDGFDDKATESHEDSDNGKALEVSIGQPPAAEQLQENKPATAAETMQEKVRRCKIAVCGTACTYQSYLSRVALR